MTGFHFFVRVLLGVFLVLLFETNGVVVLGFKDSREISGDLFGVFNCGFLEASSVLSLGFMRISRVISGMCLWCLLKTCQGTS